MHAHVVANFSTVCLCLTRCACVFPPFSLSLTRPFARISPRVFSFTNQSHFVVANSMKRPQFFFVQAPCAESTFATFQWPEPESVHFGFCNLLCISQKKNRSSCLVMYRHLTPKRPHTCHMFEFTAFFNRVCEMASSFKSHKRLEMEETMRSIYALQHGDICLRSAAGRRRERTWNDESARRCSRSGYL